MAAPASVRGGGGNAAASAAAMDAMDAPATGMLGGKLYPPEKLAALGDYLARRGVRLLVGDEHVPPGKAGGFCYNAEGGPVIMLHGNPTCYTVWHEMIHYLHYRKIGAEAYAALPRGGEKGNVPEQVVYDFLENNKKRWDALTHDEKAHAGTYIYACGGIR